MSEVESRPTRGRSSTRGGRGGYGRGGPRGGSKRTTENDVSIEESYEDQGELGEMKKKYAAELGMLKDMFPDWTDTDLVFALEEANGDIPATVDRITSGAVSQFSDVKKPKDRARSKVKEDTLATAEKVGSASRARGRGGLDSTRGGRGRGSERGRGGHRGGRGGHATTNGTIKDSTEVSVPTTESSAWETTTAAVEPSIATTEPTVAPASTAPKPAAAPEAGAKKSWASMFAQPKPVPAAIPKKAPVPQAAAPAPPVVSPPTEDVSNQENVPPAAETAEPIPPHELPAERPETSDAEAIDLAPSKVPLTEENVEHLPDASVPPSTLTAASTAGSVDPRNLTPLPQAPIGRPTMGGYATSANRLAGTVGRSASFARRVKEQQEAVVMPGHSAVDRAAVQFGSLGLNGEAGLDVDEEREDPETRQAPQHSPPSQPRTSLPPAPRPVEQSEVSAVPGVPTPKQAPGLPPASAQNQQQIQDPSLTQGLHHDQQQYSQYGRYGQPGPQADLAAQAQKQHYDPFTHQGHQSQYDQYGLHHQQQHSQQQPQSSFGGLSSAPSDYSNYYTSDPQRNYNQYYGGSYAPQDTRSQTSQGQQDPQHRTGSAFGNDSAFGSQSQQQGSRFGEANVPGSGNNTPNPVMANQHQQGAPHQQQGQHGYGAGSGFPYGHQYYSSPYPQAYQNQFGFGGPYGYGSQGKQGYGGNPYGSHPGGYESSSPATGGPFNQNHSNRAVSGSSALGGGLDDYRSGSASQGGFGNGINDGGFQRSSSGFGNQGYGQQQQGQQESASDALKPFGNEGNAAASKATGPSPRPGSAVGSQQSNSNNLPPPQSQQSFGSAAYQGFSGQNQYLGGLGAQQSGAQSGYGQSNVGGGYGSYGTGAGGFNQTYGQGYGNARGGWGQNYSQGQH